MSAPKFDTSTSAPSKWTTTIGAICDQFSGDVQTGPFGSQLHASDYSEVGTPVIMPQDMIGGRIVCDRIARVSEKHVFALSRHVLREGDLVFSRRGDVTRFAVVTESEAGWLCGTGSIRIRLNCPNILIGYARRYLQKPDVGAWLLNEAKGVTMPNLNTQIIRALPFVFPPLEEQRRIAAILDQAETLRTQRHQALAHLDTLAQSLFLDMFGDPVSNEMKWPELPLAEATNNIQIGPFGSLLHQEDYVPGGIPLINPMHIKDGKISPGAEQAISKLKYEQLGLYQLRVGDLVMGRRGEMGRCAIVSKDDGPLMCGTGSLFIRPDNAKATADYLYAVLSSARMKARLEEFSLGATMPNLNKGIVAGLKVAFPPVALQQTFATRIQTIEALKATHRTALAQLDALFASLQQRAFAGAL